MRPTTTTLALMVGCALLGCAVADPDPDPAPNPDLQPPAAAAAAQPGLLERCFQQDSISCVQKHVFRSVKAFFEREKIELPGGVSLVRAARAGAGAQEEAGAEAVLEARVLGTEAGVEAREAALEAFAARRARAFLQERSVRLDLSPWVKGLVERARALVAHIPPQVRQQVVEFAAAEARGRRKKLRRLMPMLLLGGMKLVSIATVLYLSIGFLAKKAILVSLISLVISGFIALKKILLQQPYGHYGHYGVQEAYPVHGGGGTFDISGYSGISGHAEYAAHSSPVGHAVAYSAHKPGTR